MMRRPGLYSTWSSIAGDWWEIRPGSATAWTAQLKLYFPQVLEWFDDLRTHLVCDFLLQWPTLSAAQKARRATLEKFFREHNSVRQDVIQRRVQAIKDGTPLSDR